jgi:TrpR-related protein YerC/YecD
MGQRIEVARLLKDRMTYAEISQLTGASTATISRVNRCLLYGEGGYDLAPGTTNVGK